MAVMPIAQHEKDQNRLMGIIKSLIAVIVILIVLLVGSNVGWLVYENSFEDVVITQENDDGYNNFIGNDGDITN
jgi:multisubunit Na+/H+ antiporter MnhB subunit